MTWIPLARLEADVRGHAHRLVWDIMGREYTRVVDKDGRVQLGSRPGPPSLRALAKRYNGKGDPK